MTLSVDIELSASTSTALGVTAASGRDSEV